MGHFQDVNSLISEGHYSCCTVSYQAVATVVNKNIVLVYIGEVAT
jgi:hypothetical protein